MRRLGRLLLVGPGEQARARAAKITSFEIQIFPLVVNMTFPHHAYNIAHRRYADQRAEDIPDVLYRYRSSCTSHFERELEELAHNRLYVPSRPQLNDPQDCVPIFRQTSLPDYKNFIIPASELTYIHQLQIEHRCTFEIARKIFRQNYKKWHIKMMMRLYWNDRSRDPIDGEKIGVLSLTDQPNNNAMWSMYADKFRGYIQIFDVDKSKFGSLECGEPVRVEYNDEKVTVDHFGLFFHLILGHATFAQYLKPRIIKRFLKEMPQSKWLWTKSREWSYEREFRIISLITKEYIDIKVIKNNGVIVGNQMASDALEKIRSTVKGPIFRAIPSRTSYEVEITAIQ